MPKVGDLIMFYRIIGYERGVCLVINVSKEHIDRIGCKVLEVIVLTHMKIHTFEIDEILEGVFWSIVRKMDDKCCTPVT